MRLPSGLTACLWAACGQRTGWAVDQAVQLRVQVRISERQADSRPQFIGGITTMRAPAPVRRPLSSALTAADRVQTGVSASRAI
jgi:hypothetical protein